MFYDIELGSDFSDMTPKAQENTDKSDFTKI